MIGQRAFLPERLNSVSVPESNPNLLPVSHAGSSAILSRLLIFPLLS